MHSNALHAILLVLVISLPLYSAVFRCAVNRERKLLLREIKLLMQMNASAHIYEPGALTAWERIFLTQWNDLAETIETKRAEVKSKWQHLISGEQVRELNMTLAIFRISSLSIVAVVKVIAAERSLSGVYR